MNRLSSSINNRFAGNSFLKNIVVLLSGSSVSFAITFLITPVLTLFFTPEDFGLWGMYNAVVSICVVMANGRYELALMLPKEDQKAFNLFAGSMLIALGVSLLTLILSLSFGPQLCHKLEMPELVNWLYIIPFAVIAIAFTQAGNYWHNRNKKFGVLSAGKIVQSASTAGSNLLIGKFAYFSGGLIVSTVIGQTLLALYYAARMKVAGLIPQVTWKGIREELYNYRSFPVKSGTGIFLNIVKEQVPVFILAYYFDAAIVGYYSFIIRLFSVPLTLVAGSIGQVYFQKAVEMNNSNRPILPMYRKTTWNLFLLTILPVALLMLFGPWLFTLIFGNEWTVAGDFLVIFAIYYAVRFVVSSQSALLIVFKKLDIEVGFNFIALILQVASIVIGGLQNDYYLSLYLMAITGSLIYGALGIYFWFYLKQRDEKTV